MRSYYSYWLREGLVLSKKSDFKRMRLSMVRNQLEYRRIKDQRLLEAMRKVPRHKFVPQEQQPFSYDDRPLLIGENQTISQPYIVALMTELLQLTGVERVLEIGTGSGYQAAILAELAARVYTIERHQSLVKQAGVILHELGYENIEIKHGDGSAGWVQQAPFDAIIVTAAAPTIPQPLLQQMALGGRLVLPVGGAGGQYLHCWRRDETGYQHDEIAPVAFVPLRGEHGWENHEWD